MVADCFYFLTFRVFGYRRKVIHANLKIAFPEKSEDERKKIARQFCHQFVDNFIETIKLLSCGEAFLKKRFTGNWEVFDESFSKGQSVQIHLGHNFNWEWGNAAISAAIPHQVGVVYMPIKNAAMDKLFLKMRSITGSEMIPATPVEAFRTSMKQLRQHTYAMIFAADQSPGDPSKAYWLNFFNRPTGFVTGPEKGARLGKLPVFFTVISMRRRGYYHAHNQLATADPRSLKEGELTVMFARFLEDVIRQYPANWLWSHRRWKREWKEEYGKMWIDSDEPRRVS